MNCFWLVSVQRTDKGMDVSAERACNANAYLALSHELTYNMLGIKLPWPVPGYAEFLVWAPNAWAAADRVVSWLIK